MKIAVLHPSYEGSSVPYAELDPAGDPSRHLPGHAWTDVWIHKATAVEQVTELSRLGFDAFYNFCDGAEQEACPGIEVVEELERLHLAFTGAGSRFYDPSRAAMKAAARAAGVAAPRFVGVQGAEDAGRAVKELRFPMIVKHPHGYCSVGMTRDSRVTDRASLDREVSRVLEAYGGALVEEFIEGREFTVLVAEPLLGEVRAWALDPVEFTFPPGETFKHFDLKWKDFRDMGTIPVEPGLALRLRDAAMRVFEGLEGTGFARCDFRMDAEGELFFLEINPNCGVFYPEGSHGSADLILARDPGGHRRFLQHLLDCALRRRHGGPGRPR